MFWWSILWKVLLVGGLLLFGGMAVVVSVGGLFDIKRLFARIAESHQQADETSSVDT
jgi:hypothetical protein